MSIYAKLDRCVAKFSAAIAILGGLGLVFAMAVTCLSILLKLLRRFLDSTLGHLIESDAWTFIRPILGEEEVVQYAVGLALFAALPWAMYQKSHVKIELLGPWFTDRMNRGLDLLGDLCFAIIAYLILTRQWFQIFRKARRKEEPMFDLLTGLDVNAAADRLRGAQESQILGIKLWPLYTIAEILIFCFFIVALFCALRSTRALLGRAT